jgi:hypothetical protein
VKLHRMLLAASLVAGSVLLPTPASPALAAPKDLACIPGTATAADEAIADQIRPAMNGQRLGRMVSGRAIACARIIVATVQDRGLSQRAAVIAMATAIAESTLKNHRVALDHDSLGQFQQRPSQGWGSPAELTDPEYATGAFLDAMLRRFPGGGWKSGAIGAISQHVQRSAFPGAYSPEVPDAELIVASLWFVAAPSGSGATPKPQASSKPPATKTGPYQRITASAATELGPMDGRHGLLFADWNGDGKDDLIVVDGVGAATGKTDVRVLDGARGYTSMLLNTATALGPTDAGHDYMITDWNGDRRGDLAVVQTTGTASGFVEIRIVDGASSFRTVPLETATALPATDDDTQFAMVDWNADGRPDLVATRTAGTVSRKVEVRVLDGATSFQRDLVPAITVAEAAADGMQAAITDWNTDKKPDLVLIRQPRAAGETTELRVLDGAAKLGRTLVKASTILGATDDRYAVLINDANGDKRPDLTVVQKTGTASGRAEIWVLGG